MKESAKEVLITKWLGKVFCALFYCLKNVVWGGFERST
jgi:hypothetical protein